MDAGEIVYYVGIHPTFYGQPVRILGKDDTIRKLIKIEPVNVPIDYEWSVAATQLSRVNPIVIKAVN